MTGILTFVCLHPLDTFLYAFFEVSAYLVRPAAEGALRNPKLARHSPVLIDFVTPVIDVIVQNQLAPVRLQKPQAFEQTVVLVAVDLSLAGKLRHHFNRDFPASIHLANDETSDAVEVTNRIADIRVADLRQLLHHAVDRLVGKILRVAESSGHEYPD